MIGSSLGFSPSLKGIGRLPEVLQIVVRQHDLREVDAFALAAELQQRQQALVEDGALLDGGVAVVEDLRQERVEPEERAHVALEQHQRVQFVLRGLCSAASSFFSFAAFSASCAAL